MKILKWSCFSLWDKFHTRFSVTCVPSTLFRSCSCSSSSATERQWGAILMQPTAPRPATLARMAVRAVQRSVALAVGREVSPSTVLQRDRREREVMVAGSPRAETTSVEFEKPLTTAVKESSRWYL